MIVNKILEISYIAGIELFCVLSYMFCCILYRFVKAGFLIGMY